MLFWADALFFVSLIAAPLSYGAVDLCAIVALSAAALLMTVLYALSRPQAFWQAMRSPWVIAGMLPIIWSVMQLLPLPPSIIEALSPKAFETYRTLMPVGSDPMQWHALSLNPSDTIRGLIVIGMYWLFFVAMMTRMRMMPDVVADRRSPPVMMQRAVFLRCGCLLGIFSLLSHSLYDFNLHIPANGIYFFVLLGLAVASAADTFDDLFFHRACGFVAVFGFLVALFAIIQKFEYNGHIFWIGMKAPNPVGPFYNYDHFAGFMEMCGSVSISLIAAKIFHSSFVHQKGFAKKLIWFSTPEANSALRSVVMSAVIVATVFMSTSRGGIMSFVIAQIVFLVILAKLAVRTNKVKRLALFFSAAVILAGVVVLWLGPEAFLKRFRLTSVQKIVKMEGPDADRLKFYYHTLRVIRDFPLTGTGLYTFGTNFTRYRLFRYQDEDSVEYLRCAHNDYLQLVSETGACGLLSILLFLGMYGRLLTVTARKLE